MFDKLIAALLTVCPNVDRYEAHKKEPPYMVWQEDGSGDQLSVNNKHKGDTIAGTIDMFLAEEDDSVFLKMRTALNTIPNFSWTYESTQYETDTGLIHREWSFELWV